MYIKYLLVNLPQMVHNLCGARHFQVENHWSKLYQENEHLLHNWAKILHQNCARGLVLIY